MKGLRLTDTLGGREQLLKVSLDLLCRRNKLLEHPPDLGGVATTTATRRGTSGLLDETDAESDTQGDAEDDQDDDANADPLELAPPASVLVGDVDLLVAFFHVLHGVLGLLLGALDKGFLLDDHGVEVLHQFRKLRDGPLDVQELVVSGAHVAEDCRGLAGAVGPELRGRSKSA